MAVIVQHKDSEKLFIFLGSGYGAYVSENTRRLASREKAGEFTMISICDEEGKIWWADSSEFTVISVDGEYPADILEEEMELL